MILTAENCKTISDIPLDHQPFPTATMHKSLVRIMSEGFCALCDQDIETILRDRCTVTGERESHNVMTLAGPMVEYSYTTPDGRTLHMYVVTTTMIDTWQQEWIVSAAALGWSEAGDLIEQGRRLAFPRCYPKGEEEGGA